MTHAVEIGAMIKIPVEVLGSNYKELLQELTMVNPKYSSAKRHGFGKVSASIPEYLYFYELDQNTRSIYVPRNYKNLSKYLGNFSLIDKTVKGKKIGKGCTAKLRTNQEQFFNKLVYPYINNINNNKINKDILINAFCGSGKTFMSLWLADCYSVKTIVAVTTNQIGKQFVETVKKLFPGWTVGVYDSSKKITYDITIATYALLSGKGSEFYDEFGHIILDEYHRCGAETYSEILKSAGCMYRTSLTATPRRKDGLYDILKHHAGEELVMDRDSLEADIYPVHTNISLNEDEFKPVGRFPIKDLDKLLYKEFAVRHKQGSDRGIIDKGIVTNTNSTTGAIDFLSSMHGKSVTYNIEHNTFFPLMPISVSALDTEISLISERDDLVIDLIAKCLNSGRRVLVLSKRKEQIFSLNSRLKRRGMNPDIVVSSGDADYKEYLKKLGVKHVDYVERVYNESNLILGINKLAEEGMDVPKFDTLIYLHLIKDVEQSIGRILREYDGKKKPVAFCLIDNINIYRNTFFGKKGAEEMFKNLGHNIMPTIDGIHEIKNLFLG